jgi:hypothetical protein
MWHYPMCRHYPMCCMFPTLMWSLRHLVFSRKLGTHISLIQSPILEIFSAMNSVLHFLHIYH